MISAVWLVRSHQIASELRYWLTYIGYDRRDKSLSHKIYLGYATLFFIVWGFAMLSLLATFAGGLLKGLAAGLDTLGLATPLPYAAAGTVSLVLLGWWLFGAFKAGRVSPLTFSEDDAALICQAPVSRPAVALFWLLGDWIKSGPFFWALAVTLTFALQDAALGAAVSVEYVPRYVLAGLRVLSVVLPVQWGLMALAWAWGVLRLERDRVRRFWWLGPVGLGLVLLAVLTQSGGLLPGLFNGLGGIVLKPLVFPMSAGYNLAEWAGGLAVGLAWAGLGSLALGLASRPMNLGRAAQETTGRSASEAAAQAGNARAAAEIALRSKLGTGHVPTGLAGQPGWRGLVWKTAVSWDRRGGFGALGSIIVMFVSGLAVALAPDWGTRAWAVLAWLVAVEQFVAGQLVEDLRQWPLFRGLPLTARQALLGDLALPWVWVVVLGLAAVAAAALLSGLPPDGMGVMAPLSATPLLALLVPGAALSGGLAAVVDVLRSSRSSRLMTGMAPSPGTTGVLIGGLALGLAALAVQFIGGGPAGYLLGALVTAGAAWLLLEIAADGLGGIE